MEKVMIIGAGLTGLSAGIVLQAQGIQTEIVEMAPWPGGVCTAWTRQGYTFDGCIHWMVGTRKGEPMRAVYERVHALKPDTVIHHPDTLTLEIENQSYAIPLEVHAFKTFLLEFAPEDHVAIHRFCKTIAKVAKSGLIAGKPRDVKTLFFALTKARSFLKTLIKYLDVTVLDYCKVFTNDTLIAIINHLMPAPMSMFALFMMLGTRMGQNGGFPMGGSRDMIRSMHNHYLALGGKTTFNTKITSIVVKEGIVSEIKSNQQTFKVKQLIAACDMEDTLVTMLNNQYPHPVLNTMLEKAPLFEPIMLVSLGLNRPFAIPESATLYTSVPLYTGDDSFIYYYHIRTFDFDASFAPKGGSSVMVTLSAPFDYWMALRKRDEQGYKDRKAAVSHAVLAVLEIRYPGITEAVEVIDVATPATYKRLNNLYKGSWEGFLPVPEALKTKIIKHIPGIDNLSLAGQWVKPGGGIPTAIMDGIHTAEVIMKKYKRAKV